MDSWGPGTFVFPGWSGKDGLCVEWGYLCLGSSFPSSDSLPICETDTHEFTDNKHHRYLNTRGLETEGGSPHFPNKIPEQRACKRLLTMFPVTYPVPSSPHAFNITDSHSSRPLHSSWISFCQLFTRVCSRVLVVTQPSRVRPSPALSIFTPTRAA